jgi:hypothetical protein
MEPGIKGTVDFETSKYIGDEMAHYMAGHADPRTTKLYDRRRHQVTRGEVERIRYERKAQTPRETES